MAIFVINEWLWADSFGDNGPAAQLQALDMIEWLANSQDQIIVVADSAFERKEWACCNSLNSLAQRIAGVFHAMIRLNSDRCLVLSAADAAELPDDLAASIKDDDHYLVRAQLTVAGATLVTTDIPLRETLQRSGLPCLSREEFLLAQARP